MQTGKTEVGRKELQRIVWIKYNAYIHLPNEYVRKNDLKRGDWMLVTYQGNKLTIEVVQDKALIEAVEKAVRVLDG